MNRVILIGRLGADPEVRFLPDGTPVANARLATDERWKSNGETMKRTEWHRLVAFGNLAQTISDFCKKGRLIAVEGRIQTRKWTDQNKVDRQTTEIVLSNIQFLDSAPKSEQEPPPATGTPDEDVPF